MFFILGSTVVVGYILSIIGAIASVRATQNVKMELDLHTGVVDVGFDSVRDL